MSLASGNREKDKIAFNFWYCFPAEDQKGNEDGILELRVYVAGKLTLLVLVQIINQGISTGMWMPYIIAIRTPGSSPLEMSSCL